MSQGIEALHLDAIAEVDDRHRHPSNKHYSILTVAVGDAVNTDMRARRPCL